MFPIKSYAGQSISISSDHYESMCKKWYFMKNVYSQDLAHNERVKQLLSFIHDKLSFHELHDMLTDVQTNQCHGSSI